MKLFNSVALFVSIILFSSNGAAVGLDGFKGEDGTLSIAGGTAHLPIMFEIKHKIEKFNPKILIIVRGGGSSLGIKQLGNGLIDIGNAGRPMKPQEKKQYDIQETPFAIDAICVVIHPSNPVSNLTVDTVRKIYSGEITNWKQAGGEDRLITVYNRSKTSGTRSVFSKKIMNKQAITESGHVIKDHDKMKVVVTWDKNSIGYMSLGHVDKSKIKPVALNGVAPTLATVKSGEYYLARKLYTNLPGDQTKVSILAKHFVDYLLGPDGSNIISHNGFIPIH